MDHLRTQALAFGDEPLLTSPSGDLLNLSHGFVPLLVNYTHEDKAAKGLRKRGAVARPDAPVYFSAVEVVRDHRAVLLTGEQGAGKTTFAKHLCYHIAANGSIQRHAVLRNDEGDVHDESWDEQRLAAAYLHVASPEALNAIARDTLPKLIGVARSGSGDKKHSLVLILDDIDRAGSEGPRLITEILALVAAQDNVRLVLLGETDAVDAWRLPDELSRHSFLPLLQRQRQQAIGFWAGVPADQVIVGTGAAAANLMLFVLAYEAGHAGDQTEAIVDAWLAHVAPDPSSQDDLAAESLRHLRSCIVSPRPDLPFLMTSTPVQQLLAARHLASQPLDVAMDFFRHDPHGYEPILRSLLFRLRGTKKARDLIQTLILGQGPMGELGPLLASDFLEGSTELQDQARDKVLAILQDDSVPIRRREKAGRILSRLGDPRDLTALVDVPAGTFFMGSDSHVNSQPVCSVSLEAFRISAYPVVNRDYDQFVMETGRVWLSPDGLNPERRNVPATDLSWHDARAYCSWLTHRWQASGQISRQEIVRLPSEAEWERAARGEQGGGADPGATGQLVYPWGVTWRNGAANCDETGLNGVCTVGLYPGGASPYGCYDMVGQAWEWCSTLWGDDMAAPSFAYPWRADDGREALEADESLRRILRGGCFSSPPFKVTATYRGSLEPAGSWRGNGFRIVVARV